MKESVTIVYNGMEYNILKEEYEKLSTKNIDLMREYDKFNKRRGFTEVALYNNIQHVSLQA